MAIDNSSAEVSTMLRGELRGVMTERLPALLFLRNPGLRGKVEVTSTKVFTDKDKTKKGQSMAGWRLMELTGDSAFYESLAGFEEDHQFQLRGSTILIKGGTRKPGNSQRAKPTGNQNPPPGNNNTNNQKKKKTNQTAPPNKPSTHAETPAPNSKGNQQTTPGPSNSNTSSNINTGPRGKNNLFSFHNWGGSGPTLDDEILDAMEKERREEIEKKKKEREEKKRTRESTESMGGKPESKKHGGE